MKNSKMKISTALIRAVIEQYGVLFKCEFFFVIEGCGEKRSYVFTFRCNLCIVYSSFTCSKSGTGIVPFSCDSQNFSFLVLLDQCSCRATEVQFEKQIVLNNIWLFRTCSRNWFLFWYYFICKFSVVFDCLRFPRGTNVTNCHLSEEKSRNHLQHKQVVFQIKSFSFSLTKKPFSERWWRTRS